MLRLAGVSMTGANLVDNLPSYLAISPVAAWSSLRMAAVLVGVNSGPMGLQPQLEESGMMFRSARHGLGYKPP